MPHLPLLAGLLFLLLAGAPVSAQEPTVDDDGRAFDPVEPGTIPGRIRQAILESDLGVSVPVLSLDIVKGIGIGARYRYELDSDHSGKVHTRVDSWELKADLKIGDIIQELVDLPLGFRISARRRIIMARQFPTKQAAALALPKTPVGLPISAKHADKLGVGDFFSVPGELSFVSGIGGGYGIAGFSGRLEGRYIVSGRFRVQVIKVDEHRVRLRLIGLDSRGPAGEGKIRFGLQIFSIGFIDLKPSVELAKIGRRGTSGTAFNLDYVFDLRDPKARDAYDKVLGVTLRTSELLSGQAVLQRAGLERALLTDLRPAETLFDEDRHLPPEERRVHRLFRGSNEFQGELRDVRFGIPVLEFKRNNTWIENRLEVLDEADQVSRYSFSLFATSSRWNVLFGLAKEEIESRIFALAPLHDDEASAAEDLVFDQVVRDRRASGREVRKLHEGLTRTLGHEIGSRLGLESFPQDRTGGLESRITIGIHRDALFDLVDPVKTPPGVVGAAISRLLQDHGWIDEDEIDQVEQLPDDLGESEPEDSAEQILDGVDLSFLSRFGPRSRGRVRELLSKFLTVQRLPIEPRLRALALHDLFEHRLFRAIGLRFMIEMMGSTDLEQRLYVRIVARGEGEQQFLAQLGEDTHRALYIRITEALQYLADTDRELERDHDTSVTEVP